MERCLRVLLVGVLVIGLAVIIVFIAAFTLFWVIDSLNRLAEQCKQGLELEICEKMSGFTFQMLIVLILIGGLIATITAVGFIILSTLSK